MSDVTNPDKPGYLTLRTNEGAIEFHISDFKKYQNTYTAQKVMEFFQKTQEEADSGNKAAISLINNLIEEPLLPRTIRISSSENYNGFDKTNGLTFGFKYNGTYAGTDGKEHHYTPERMFAHEMAHAASERTQPEGNLAMDAGSVHKYRAEGQAPGQFKKNVEEPAVRSENYIASEVFGPDAAGVPRASYDKHRSQADEFLQKPQEVLASLPAHQLQVVGERMLERFKELQQSQVIERA